MCRLFCSILQLGAAARLEGITPAAVVSLLSYVHITKKNKETRRYQQKQKEEREEELCANSASLPQWLRLKLSIKMYLFLGNYQKKLITYFGKPFLESQSAP